MSARPACPDSEASELPPVMPLVTHSAREYEILRIWRILPDDAKDVLFRVIRNASKKRN